ncbi:outer membrane beta-barrel protein [Phaeodactylibacter sp.]|uniref:porin family protein n=1 Tax=Phaeodactylibacter sp. TaxID=1940289 RepID=UPI0026002DDA|nr:outer membrane beta-barrel protein [Phaeodactylibacter sp.]MCI4647100.1 outer membrane beta-barrel protein [Phaeodactylibacter sp.]MCI5093556.1 outer membrane beta-barrel protein [Phaeodactylibacter sp.]
MKERKDGLQHLREQLEDFEYEVPFTGWKEMSAILDGERPVPQPAVPEKPRRRFAGWIWFVGALLLVGSGVWLSAQQEQRLAFRTNSQVLLSALPVPLPSLPRASKTKTTATAVASVQVPAPNGLAPVSAPPMPPARSAQAESRTAPAPVRRMPVPLADLSKNQLDTITHTPDNDNIPNPEAPDTIATRDEERVFAATAPIPALPPKALTEPSEAADMPEINPAALHRWSFGLKAGADYQSLQTNALLGGFAQVRLHRKWVLEAGLQYKRRSENNGSGLGISPPLGDTIYLPAFASISPYHRSITRVHFLEAPVTLQYQIGKRLRVMGGMQVAYLRSTDQPVGIWNNESSRNDMEQASGDFLLAGSANTPPGATARFEQWDLGLIAGLDYRIASHWSVDLRWQQGLRDLTPESYYQNNEVYNNTSLQFALKWHW